MRDTMLDAIFRPASTMAKGVWRKEGHPDVIGLWKYRGSDRFVIWLDSSDPVTGQQRQFQVTGDKPEFNGYTLVKLEDR